MGNRGAVEDVIDLGLGRGKHRLIFVVFPLNAFILSVSFADGVISVSEKEVTAEGFKDMVII
jgi:hypothetical protein